LKPLVDQNPRSYAWGVGYGLAGHQEVPEMRIDTYPSTVRSLRRITNELGTTQQGFVTVSVDDGYPTDLRAADLLERLGYAATFYVPARNPERAVIGTTEVRRLAESFELGAHTYSHVPLPSLDDLTAQREILDGKSWLEDAISKPVYSFCYPRGKFNRRVVELVKQAGFVGARTTMGNLVSQPNDVFIAGTTTQAFSHSRVIHARHAAIEGNCLGMLNFARIFRFATDWTAHFEQGVAHVSKHGGVAHLWFHSWELDQFDQWSRLEQLLRRLSDLYQFQTATNGYLAAGGCEVRIQEPELVEPPVSTAA
jgi:peptidoglycan-N-acetylglucosamine deacetylase